MEIQWFRHDKLTSTNRLLWEMLKQEHPSEGVVVMADYQEAGKGYGDHSWHSRAGENLLMSLLLFPAFLSASRQFHLKWPNDILCKGGKVAGLLLEHGVSGGTLSHTIAGIGLNLNQREFPGFPIPASSLILETGRETVPRDIAGLLVHKIMDRYQKLRDGEGQALEEEYLHRLYRLGERSVFEAGGEVFDGKITGISPFGELLVEREGKQRAYGHGEISLKIP